MKGKVLAFFLLLVATPTMGRAQSTLNFPKHFTAGELASSGFTVVNPSSTAATVTFTLYSADGQAVRTAQKTFDPGTQDARLGAGANQIFGTASLGEGGWVQATTPVSGLTGFWLTFDANFSNSGDGAEAAGAATNQVLPVVAGTTELNIAYPSSSGGAQNVTIDIIGDAGTVLAPGVVRSINGNGVFKSDVASLFSGVNIANVRYVRVVSTSPVAACVVVRQFLVSTDAAIVNGVNTAAGTTVNQVAFPHSISDADWTSVIGVTNLSTSQNSITITFTPVTDGRPPVAGTSPPPVTRTLPANGSLRENVRDLFGFSPTSSQTGWIKVDGNQPLTGFVAYASTVNGGLAVVPVQAAPQSRMLFAHIADGEPNIWWTGLAFLNTSAAPVTVKVYAMKPTGELIGGADNESKATLVLPPNTKTAKLLNEIIPQIQNSVYNGGFIYVTTSSNVYASELFFTRDLKIVANVAAGTLATGINFIPPVVQQPLSITGLAPSRIARGGTLTISGTGFSVQPSNNSVLFTSANGTSSVSASTAIQTSLTVTVPQDAISGPVQVRVAGETVTSGSSLDVTATSSAIVETVVTVQSGQLTTDVDIFVPPSSGDSALNASAVGAADLGQPVMFSSSSVEITRGSANVTKQLVVAGSGITALNGTKISVSGSGVTISPPQQFQVLSDGTTIVFLSITVAPNAGPGARNVILTNSNLDTAVLSGAVIIK